MGRQVRYLVESGHGYLGAVSFGSSALRLEAREHFIGWNEEQRMRHKNDVINMSRFLIVNDVTCKNLASRVLSMVVKRIKPLFGFAGVKEENWAEQEFGGAELGDLRLSRRLVKIADQKGSLQGASYARAAGGVRLDIKQYYYFIDLKKEQVTFEAILSPHRSCTVRRMAGMDTVLVVQDTTDINYTKIRECEGLGPIGTNQKQGEGDRSCSA